MGWRDRDWAKLDDDEWEAIYGYRRQSIEPTDGPGRNRARHTANALGALLLVVVAVLGWVALHRSHEQSAHPVVTPAVLYGIRGGTNTVCTEMAIAQGSTEWRCLTWTVNLHDTPVVQPRRYAGPCGHAIVDQTRGAWTCLSAVPLPDNALPNQQENALPPS